MVRVYVECDVRCGSWFGRGAWPAMNALEYVHECVCTRVNLLCSGAGSVGNIRMWVCVQLVRVCVRSCADRFVCACKVDEAGIKVRVVDSER